MDLGQTIKISVLAEFKYILLALSYYPVSIVAEKAVCRIAFLTATVFRVPNKKKRTPSDCFLAILSTGYVKRSC